MKSIISYMKGHYLQAFLSIILTSVVVITELLQPQFMASVIDVSIPAGDIHSVIIKGLWMVGLSLAGIVFGVAAVFSAGIASTGFAENIRNDAFSKIQTFSFANIDSFGTASLVTRLTTDTSFLQNTAMMALRMLVRAPVMLVGALFMAFATNVELSFILLAAIPVLVAVLLFIILKGVPLFVMMQKKTDTLNARIQENVTNIRVVKSFVREDFEKEKFAQINDAVFEAAVKATSLMILVSPAMMFVMNFATIFIVWFAGSKIVVGGDLLVGDLMIFINYLMQTLMSLLILSFTIMMFARSRASAERIKEILKTNVDIVNPDDTQDVEVVDGGIEFRDVSFAYNNDDESRALNHISFKINSGETIGIIGPTGSGKTTLVQLILRMYDVTEGAVVVSGLDVRRYELEVLRSSIGMVLQKNVLFSGTIRENLLWGNESAHDDDLIAACEKAAAAQFIRDLPNAYDTVVQQGGANFSGGQKQRLCIARALVKKHAIVILDDSTSAVDTATEAHIKKSFAESLVDTTVLLIAQKISSIADADRIIVLDKGTIVGFDTHTNLLKANDVYREIYNSQQEGA